VRAPCAHCARTKPPGPHARSGPNRAGNDTPRFTGWVGIRVAWVFARSPQNLVGTFSNDSHDHSVARGTPARGRDYVMEYAIRPWSYVRFRWLIFALGIVALACSNSSSEPVAQTREEL